jgi:curli biogenesis system outer membrane secretion channel CsgG
MNNFPGMLCLMIVLVSGCSSETAKRTAYETLQNIHEQDCLKDPNSPSECRKRDSYEDYQRQQKALEPSN